MSETCKVITQAHLSVPKDHQFIIPVEWEEEEKLVEYDGVTQFSELKPRPKTTVKMVTKLRCVCGAEQSRG